MEDPMSVASYITFGQFHTAHLGDLTRNMEFKPMCPSTRLPPVQLFLGLHHGVESSNAEVMVHGLRPRVAIINNGTRKGGDPHTMTSVHTSPGLEDLWQIHFSQLSGQEYTQPGMFIANRLDDDSPTMPIAPIATPGPMRLPRPFTTARPIGSKCRPCRTARSPLPISATAFPKPTALRREATRATSRLLALKLS